MKQRSFPIGPLDELQAALTGKLTTKRKQHLHLKDIEYGTMWLVRVAYRTIQLEYACQCLQGVYGSPRIICDLLEERGLRGVWPALWFQVSWLATCWEHGIALADARDYGPSKLWTGSSAVPKQVRRAYKR